MSPGNGGPARAPEPIVAAPDEVAMLRRVAEVVGPDYLDRWMASSIPSLGNRTPGSLIATAEGRQAVERVLLRIEHGVY